MRFTRLLFAGLILLLGEWWGFTAPQSPAVFVPICSIQSDGFTSPYLGQAVTTRGVVYADLDLTWVRGFYMQQADCDSLTATSDGIFVYLDEKIDLVQPGDYVEVSGTVQEYYGLTEISVSPSSVTVLIHNYPLPVPVQVYPPADNAASRVYFEARESMYAAIDQGRVVGPTDYDARSWLVQADLGIAHVFEDDPDGTGELLCVDDAGLYEITPQVKVGDQVQQLKGALDFRYSTYCLQLTAVPLVLPSPLPVDLRAGTALGLPAAPEIPEALATGLTLTASPIYRAATYNLANLFDTIDDPVTEDSVVSETEYLRRLEKHALAFHSALEEPEILAVQEVENSGVLEDLLARPEILSQYQFILENGPDKRGLDIAVLYRSDRVILETYQVRQGCTSLVDGLGPDGNLDVYHPVNAITCDTNADGILDGNRLFSRPPLVLKLSICVSQCPSYQVLGAWVINNHLKSKTEDTSTVAFTLPRRVEQAAYVAGLVQEILGIDPEATILVLGDLNDTPASQPVGVLQNQGLYNVLKQADRQTRYTYIYHGIAQVLDYIMLRAQPGWAALSVQPVHLNADFPVDYATLPGVIWRSSDHDPVVAAFGYVGVQLYLPMVLR